MKFLHPRTIDVLVSRSRLVYQVPLYFAEEKIVGKVSQIFELYLPQYQTTLPFSLSLDESNLTLALSSVPHKTVLERMNELGQPTPAKVSKVIVDLE